MLNLPIYRIGSTYYLHTRVDGKQVKRSLFTGYRREAMIRAIALLHELRMTKKAPPIKYEIDAANGIFKADGPEDHARLMQALEAMKAMQAMQAGQQQAPATPQQPQQPQQLGDDPTALKLGELLEKFFLLRKVKQSTAISYRNAVTEFSKFLKNPPITRVTASDVTRFQEFLKKKGNELRTIDSKVGVIKTMYNFAKKHGHTRGENPAQNLSLLTKKQKQRSGFIIFEKTELESFLSSQFFIEQQAKDPDYTHAVMLAMFTGCRISEITNLKKDQFKKSSKGTAYITIRDSKTKAGIREVPLHPYISNCMAVFIANKSDKVFKYVEKEGKGSGNAVGKKFARNLESAGITREKLVFHSLRKFVNNELMKNNVSLEYRCQFIGHELDNVNISAYTDLINVDDLAAAVFPTLKIIAEMFEKALDPMEKVDLGNILDMDALL